jgi:hypothetical protein
MARRRYAPATSLRGRKGLSGGARRQLEAAAARSNKNEKKEGAEPDSAIPSEVVDKNIREREARGGHRRW